MAPQSTKVPPATGQRHARTLQFSGAANATTGAALADLAAAPAEELRAMWRAERGTWPPAAFTARLLRHALAWDAQLAGQGAKVPEAALKQIAQRRAAGAGSAEAVSGLKPPPAPVGTRLLRVWGGQTHEVIVLDEGVLWRGGAWSSLSVVARAITGSPRNGPQFVGLRRKG